jgi:hypothetical protein
MLLEKQYKIPFDMFRDAFIAFQRRFVYPKSYIIMAVLAVVIGIYAYSLVYGGENANRGLYCMIILFCLMMMAFQYINPRKIRMKLMEGVKEIEDDSYRLRVFPEYLEIGTILPPEDTRAAESDDLFDDVPEEDFSGTRIHYNKGLNVIEYPGFFMIYQQKSMFYVVPKSAFSEEELEILRVHFAKRLEKTFRTAGK